MICKLGLCGATGKMGSEIAALLANSYSTSGVNFELADVVVHSDRIKSIDGVETRLLKDPPREPVHVWVDFSQPAATLDLLKQISTPIVIGTTGFKETDLQKIHAFSKDHAVFLAPNFSPGIQLMKSFLKSMPEKLPVDLVLTESHHRQKKDSPSGTAKAILETLISRKYDKVTVHAIRAGKILGIHDLRILFDDEELEIKHTVNNRAVFARGALDAAAFIMKKPPGLYAMDQLLHN